MMMMMMMVTMKVVLVRDYAQVHVHYVFVKMTIREKKEKKVAKERGGLFLGE